jgi:protein involved in polysaccharide export with SLBB domain
VRHRLSIALFVVLTVVGGSGCSTMPKHGAASASADPRFDDSLLAVAQPDRLHPGQWLQVLIEKNPPAVPWRISIERTVQEDGTVALVSNKIFTAAGKTFRELEQELRAYYTPKLFKSVRITSLDHQLFFYVAGEVLYPSRQIYGSRITLGQAIACAGGFTLSANRRKVRVTGYGGERRTIDCTNAHRLEEEVEILRGDLIFVPRSSKSPFW